MSDQMWVFLGILVTQLATAIGSYTKIRTQGKTADQTLEAAEQAAAQTKATGNGFAKRVETSLEEIKTGMLENRANITALTQAAQADRELLTAHIQAHTPTIPTQRTGVTEVTQVTDLEGDPQ